MISCPHCGRVAQEFQLLAQVRDQSVVLGGPLLKFQPMKQIAIQLTLIHEAHRLSEYTTIASALIGPIREPRDGWRLICSGKPVTRPFVRGRFPAGCHGQFHPKEAGYMVQRYEVDRGEHYVFVIPNPMLTQTRHSYR